eukprot:TRINITY_DN51749_c0_g1_i1.p2 TRINITY_DN51749_c0_g1~~TRINITY_DN51749_c0_g1_i1.p2  ORF type:complete len:171 (-),score=61.86 TRINITY_DN51749_c0_g1_i1:25-537(-)
MTVSQSVIFCNTRKKVEWLAKKLTYEKFTVSAMHGDMTQEKRDDIMKQFKQGATRVLLTTDVWSRGIDVEQISLVVNYDLPINRELYIHRIGRAGRFGRAGVAINLVKKEELKILKDIEQFYSTSIEELPENTVSYTHLRAHETPEHLVCRLLLEKKKKQNKRNGIVNAE